MKLAEIVSQVQFYLSIVASIRVEQTNVRDIVAFSR